MYDRIYSKKYKQKNKERIKIQQAEYKQRPEVKLRRRLYIQIEEIKQKNREWQSKYNKSPKGKQKRLIREKTYLQNRKNGYRWLLHLWSKLVKERDIFKCKICESICDDSHHIFAKSKYPGLEFNINNGISLCIKHHNEIHDLNGWR